MLFLKFGGLPFFVAAAFILFDGWKALNDHRYAIEAAEWPTALGEITASEARPTSGTGGTSRTLYKIQYSFVVNGRTFSSASPILGDFANQGKHTGKLYQNNRVGDEVSIRFNPENPNVSAIVVVEPNGFPISSYVPLAFGSVALALGCYLYFLFWQEMRVDQRKT